MSQQRQRTYTRELKREAIRLYKSTDKSISEVLALVDENTAYIFFAS